MSAASDLRASAEAMLKPGQELAFSTDATGQPGVVLMAIVRAGKFSAVLAIDAAEYHAQLPPLELFGLTPATPPTALDRAKALKREKATA